MDILVYGAGPLGSLLAARLQEGGNDVSILARGQRLKDLRKHGIVLQDTQTEQRTTTQVTVVESLAHDDAYDLILVVMRKNNAVQILPTLAANTRTPNVLFLMNNGAGPGQLVDALGKDRVLIGFPGAAGYREGHVVCHLGGTEDQPATVLFGEIDGSTSSRTQQVAQAIDAAPGLKAEVRADMDTWLRYHIALLMPALGPVLYMCGTDNYRAARTRDAVVLAVRGIGEAIRVLRAQGRPVTPRKYAGFLWVPEPIMVRLLQRVLANPAMEVAMVKHAEAARDEVQYHADEFIALARTTGVPIPTIERLHAYLDPDAPQMPDGSAEIPLRWTGMIAGLGALTMALLALALLVNWLVGSRG